jgi:hypothetical protein
MIEQTYFGLLKSLNVPLDYRSDNLFKIRESEVEQYIGKQGYLELKEIFEERQKKKYMVGIGEMGFLHPVKIIGINEECYYVEKDNLLGLSEVHYIMSSDYNIYTITKAKEYLIIGRIPEVGEYDNMFKGLIENNSLLSEYENESEEIYFVFDIRDSKREELLRVLSVQSVYKQYCCYVAIVEDSAGKIKKIPLQKLVIFR